jgi:hypothetical protein
LLLNLTLPVSFPDVYQFCTSGFAHDYGMLTTYHGFSFKGQYYKEMSAGLSKAILHDAGWATADLEKRKTLAIQWFEELEKNNDRLYAEEPAFKLPGAIPFKPIAAHVLKPQNHVVVASWAHFTPTHHGMRPPPREPEPENFCRRSFLVAEGGWAIGFVPKWTISFHTDKSQTKLLQKPKWGAPFGQPETDFGPADHQDKFPDADLATLTQEPSAAVPVRPNKKPSSPPPPPVVKPAALPDPDRDSFASLLDKFDYISPEERDQLVPALEKSYQWGKLKPLFPDGKILMMRSKTFVCAFLMALEPTLSSR